MIYYVENVRMKYFIMFTYTVSTICVLEFSISIYTFTISLPKYNLYSLSNIVNNINSDEYNLWVTLCFKVSRILELNICF